VREKHKSSVHFNFFLREQAFIQKLNLLSQQQIALLNLQILYFTLFEKLQTKVSELLYSKFHHVRQLTESNFLMTIDHLLRHSLVPQ
jgi:hypothetical protein